MCIEKKSKPLMDSFLPKEKKPCAWFYLHQCLRGFLPHLLSPFMPYSYFLSVDENTKKEWMQSEGGCALSLEVEGLLEGRGEGFSCTSGA